ncbi:hypothetical protein SAMN05518866_10387 [Sphingobium sp. YR768]|nr:hypothetical protein SAMN05518866_10387 [Sphingobium sp. YR768]
MSCMSGKSIAGDGHSPTNIFLQSGHHQSIPSGNMDIRKMLAGIGKITAIIDANCRGKLDDERVLGLAIIVIPKGCAGELARDGQLCVNGRHIHAWSRDFEGGRLRMDWGRRNQKEHGRQNLLSMHV